MKRTYFEPFIAQRTSNATIPTKGIAQSRTPRVVPITVRFVCWSNAAIVVVLKRLTATRRIVESKVTRAVNA